jgi:hypothetical protein
LSISSDRPPPQLAAIDFEHLVVSPIVFGNADGMVVDSSDFRLAGIPVGIPSPKHKDDDDQGKENLDQPGSGVLAENIQHG